MKVYKVSSNEGVFVFSNIQVLLGSLRNELEEIEADEDNKFIIEVIKMSKEEFNKLPDEGYE